MGPTCYPVPLSISGRYDIGKRLSLCSPLNSDDNEITISTLIICLIYGTALIFDNILQYKCFILHNIIKNMHHIHVASMHQYNYSIPSTRRTIKTISLIQMLLSNQINCNLWKCHIKENMSQIWFGKNWCMNYLFK